RRVAERSCDRAELEQIDARLALGLLSVRLGREGQERLGRSGPCTGDDEGRTSICKLLELVEHLGVARLLDPPRHFAVRHVVPGRKDLQIRFTCSKVLEHRTRCARLGWFSWFSRHAFPLSLVCRPRLVRHPPTRVPRPPRTTIMSARARSRLTSLRLRRIS